MSERRPISYSAIWLWHRCRYQYHLEWERRIRRRIDPRPLRMGSAIHAGIEAALKGKSRREAAAREAVRRAMSASVERMGRQPTEEEWEQIDQIGRDSTIIALRTLDYLQIGKKWRTVRWRKAPLIESRLEVPLEDDVFVFKVDWIAREVGTGLGWIVDYKGRSSFQPEESEEVNLQGALYQKAMQILGLELAGTITLQIKLQAPKTPTLNKNGTMSRTLIATDWKTYARSVKEAGLDPGEYEDMRPKLDGIEFYRMNRAYRGQRELDAIWNEIAIPAARAIRQEESRVRNMHPMTCKGCRMRELCLGGLRGEDVGFIMDSMYETPETAGMYAVPELIDDDQEEV